MKSSFCFLLALLCFSKTIIAHEIPELPVDEYRAQRSQEENVSRELPQLDYWGIQGFQWGDTETTVASRQNKPTRMLGSACQRSFACDKATRLLHQVRYDFAAGVTNREERLLVYQSIKAGLVKAYNGPTTLVKADEVFRGKDAYVQGLDKEYALEWAGPETIVRLVLSDNELRVEFSQAPTSAALVKKQKVDDAVRHRAEILRLMEEEQRQSKAKPK
ncbi:MAG: hypothetical protein HY299_12595 [Verrucomicrobia bacterium]|nr:hypothetical protein [Verrucomicrobiota bacterium]